MSVTLIKGIIDIAPNKGIFSKYMSGMFVSDNTTMVVSKRIGNSTISFIINNRPELIVITLKDN